MNRGHQIGFALVGALTVLGTPAAPTQAQRGGRTSTAAVLRLPCCRCAGGAATQVSINSGAAPWQVTRPSGSGGSQTAAVPVGELSGNWTTALLPAVWIGPPGAPDDFGDHSYELTVIRPPCIIPSRANVTGTVAADDLVRRVYVDSNSVAAGTMPGWATGLGFGPIGINAVGAHTVRVVVNNGQWSTGMVLRGTITISCPQEREPTFG